MRRRIHRITRLAAVTLLASAAAAPVATAGGSVSSERAGEVATPSECAAWAAAMSRHLAYYGITGARADSYIAQRADNPCHRPITARSLFHAGDPGS
jgi:hypothetical protein